MLETRQEHWSSRPPAKKFLKFAFTMALVLTLFLGLAVAELSIVGEAKIQQFSNHWWLQVAGFLVGVLGAPCAVSLWIGMLGHLVSAKRRGKSGKVVWLFALIFGNWLAAPFYYLVSYKKESAEIATNSR